MPKTRRRLFLDDDPRRAEVFLAEHPDATWVQTSAECIARLAEPWDEVHLDHDLGGEHYVDPDRDDCGMAVVRWLAGSPGVLRHLRKARFTVHSHNVVAAYTMVLRIRGMGYQVEARPFGLEPPKLDFEVENSSPGAWSWKRLGLRALALVRRHRSPEVQTGAEPVDLEPPGPAL